MSDKPRLLAAQQLAYLSGLLHDIGKISLPPGLLEKPPGRQPSGPPYIDRARQGWRSARSQTTNSQG